MSPLEDVPETDINELPAELPAGLVVLDVREDDEWDAGHIDGATHIPLGQLEERVGDIPAGDQVLVVCRLGGRSARATAFLTGTGVNAVNLDGGMRAWADGGRAITRDSGEPAEII
jgi:rhodanese-related sulfurtransferase